MRFTIIAVTVGMLASGLVAAAPTKRGYEKGLKPYSNIQLGPRPFYLVENMDPGPLKQKLQSCTEGPFKTSDFSISHRGGPLQFPEHTKESWLAAAREGAGTIECDVIFTKDRQLVCRHSQCDLHTTTNILTIPELAAKCNQIFTPAANGKPASAECCTSDITLAEFKSLCGKMNGFNASATTPEDYQHGTPRWRTDLYATCGTLFSHKEYIALIDSVSRKFVPELKTPSVAMPYEGDYAQEMYAQQMIDEYKAAGISPKRVWSQSFLPDDIFYWIKAEPAFGKQAVYLDERVDTPEGYDEAVASLPELKQKGVKIMAPSIPALLTVDGAGKIVPSTYATTCKTLGLDMITWSLERSGLIADVAANKDYYYTSFASAVNNDGDIYTVVDVLARQVGIIGLFADWPSTVTYYANCFKL
jgi:glycerophosphoryl diester phosphodiesterase